jgi:WD40 repeat protein
VPHFHGLQFDSIHTLQPVDILAALSDTTVVWSQGNKLFAWSPVHAKHTESWFVGQVLDSHITCLVALSSTNFMLMTPRHTLQEWHVALGRQRFVDVLGSPRGLALLSNAELAISYCDSSIGVWNPGDDTHRDLVHAARSWSGYVQSFVWSPPIAYGDTWRCLTGLPDCRLAAGSRDGVVCIFDALAGTCLRSCSLKEKVAAMTWGTHNARLLISTPRKVIEWDLQFPPQDLSQLKALPCGGTKHLLALEDGTAVVLEVESNREAMQTGDRKSIVACQGVDRRVFGSGTFFGLANLGHCRMVAGCAGGLIALA